MANQTLDAFLHPVERDVLCTLTISKRFVNADGTLATVTIRTISEEHHAKIKKSAMRRERIAGKIEERFDEAKYKNELLRACIVEPNFFTKDACLAYGADPDSVLSVIFNTGEYNDLVYKVLLHNGLVDDIEDDKHEESLPQVEREVKN